MSSHIRYLLIGVILAFGPVHLAAQTGGLGTMGPVVIKGLGVKGTDKQKPLSRKRFYLFSGGLKDNDALIQRINAAEITSRDCYYSQLQPAASSCFIKWLQANSCESPFCRKIGAEDKQGVKEFEDAFTKGLTLYNRREDLALSWIVNNMPQGLVSGYHDMQKKAINDILGGMKPLDDTMTTPNDIIATFVDIPFSEQTVKITVSTLIPVEIGMKSYVWTCEADVQKNKQATIILTTDATKKNCALKIRDVKTCSTGTCDKK
jgi:hypothetical protein